jgi:hypothetical protein
MGALFTGSLIVLGSHVSNLLDLFSKRGAPLFGREFTRFEMHALSPIEVYETLQMVVLLNLYPHSKWINILLVWC